MVKGYDVAVCFDDLSKHSKSFRQISLIIGKIPSRDAFPADIFNVHSSLLERCGKLKGAFGNAACTAFPIIETINSDITEFIATNVISITDGQLYMSKKLFFEGVRPSIDSALSVSRIGSAAQCKLMKLVSLGVKNRVTALRLGVSSGLDAANFVILKSFHCIYFQEHFVSLRLELLLVVLLSVRSGFVFPSRRSVHCLSFLLSSDFMLLFYLVFISKSVSNPLLISFFSSFSSLLLNFVA